MQSVNININNQWITKGIILFRQKLKLYCEINKSINDQLFKDFYPKKIERFIEDLSMLLNGINSLNK